MKIFKWLLILLLGIFIFALISNYPKLNIISGYSAKNTSSSVFVGHRNLALTDSTDNAFSPVNLAKDEVDFNIKKASASVFGMLERTAIYREGLGSVLINETYDPNKPYLTPNRTKNKIDSIAYPFGSGEPVDSLFSSLDYNQLKNAISNAFDKKNENIKQTRAVLVLYKDHIIGERYAAGFNEKSVFLGWSMTKSIISTLYGVLEHQKKLSITDKAPIEEWKNDNRAAIDLSDLLQMNSGLEWDENYGTISDVTKMLFLESNMTTPQIYKPAIANPGEVWNYSSGTSNLLSGILRDQFATHQEYLDFPYEALIDKIGMHSMLMEADLDGNYVASSYGWGTARDWAKFGVLYLHKGNWNGAQVFNPNWVSYVTTPAPNSGKDYGAHFWLNAGAKLPDVPKSIYYADGFQGQRVFIIPSHDMIVVRFGLSNIDFNAFLKEILASVKPS
ncbi:serine hydrolase domain-containing protein [Ascidiimonas sp. W6]|uniref:serine hydrolase domain-containing protein n=1 Tax=Ascidiimonas meishanensis TaxID=3128903 RepID=UPI0030ECA1D3